ncbi:G/T mismatch-specific thymine DNA glycosylase-like [Stylophora pistillata]|uniref:G/T mismatch-specific thymine DNA glycosylase-like n=1 Tax=Stylophora pistillata TaxID=50429 RepID=UPI000C038D7C|nr:G/T mismatch-specific thymine DNA glycosylase-like [Stylophora pistillata]
MQNQKESLRYSPYFTKKSGVCDEAKGTNTSKEESKNTGKSPKKPRRLVKRFGEMSEEDVLKLKLPEHLDYNLDILFVGINPGLMAAYKGHHYAGANNHFWPCLYESGLVPERLTYLDDVRCPSYGIGLTNMVERTTRGSADLSRQEMRDGKGELIRKVELYKPLIVCFNGKGWYINGINI